MRRSTLSDAALHTLILLSVVNALSYVHRVLPGAVAPLLKAEFKLTDAELGLVTGFAFSLFYAVVSLPLARVADTGPRRLMIGVSVAIWSALTVLCGLVTGAWQFIVCRFGVGAAESAATPAAYSIITDSFRADQRPMAFSMLIGGTMVGLLIGLALGGWLGAEFGWRTAFIVLGAPGLILAAAVHLFVKEPQRGASDVASTLNTRGSGYLELFRNRPFAWMLASNALGTFNIFVVSIWLPVFFQRTHHMPMAIVSLVFGFGFGGGLLAGTILGGVLGARTARLDALDLRLPIFAYMALPPIYWLLLWLPHPWIALALVMVAAVVFALGNPTFAAASQSVVAANDRAKAMATLVLGNSIVGYGLGSWAVGLLSDIFAPVFGANSLRVALSLGQGFSILGGLCLVMAALVIRKHRALLGSSSPRRQASTHAV